MCHDALYVQTCLLAQLILALELLTQALLLALAVRVRQEVRRHTRVLAQLAQPLAPCRPRTRRGRGRARPRTARALCMQASYIGAFDALCAVR